MLPRSSGFGNRVFLDGTGADSPQRSMSGCSEHRLARSHHSGSLLLAGMGPELEDQDAEVLVHPGLLVRIAASGVLGQLRLDRGLDPQPCGTEHVDQVGDGMATLGEGDLTVPTAEVGEPRGGEVLLAQGGLVLFGLFDGVSNRLRLGQQDESIVGQHRARCLQSADWICRVAERLQEQDPVERAASKPRHGIQLIEIALDQFQARHWDTEEVATDIDTDGGSRTVSNQLSELASVAATEVEYRPSGDIAQKISLRWPLHESVQRVLPGAGPLVVRSEFQPGMTRVHRIVPGRTR